MSKCVCIHCRLLRGLRYVMPRHDWDGLILKNVDPRRSLAEIKSAVSPVLHDALLRDIETNPPMIPDSRVVLALWWEWHTEAWSRNGWPEPVLPWEAAEGGAE